MVKKRRTKRFLRASTRPLPVSQGLSRFLAAMGGSPERARLAALWENWLQVLGSPLGEMAIPLGAREDTVLLGARDGLEIMELSLQSPEIVEKINTFLEAPHFKKARICLLGRQKAMNMAAPRPLPRKKGAVPIAHTSRPRGEFLDGMDMSSPVARCYARFARREKDQ